MMKSGTVNVVVVFFLLSIGTPAGGTIVSTVQELVDAIDAANVGGDKLIECENGTYQLSNLLHVIADSVTVRSLSGNRDDVIISGQGMGGGVTHVFLVEGSDFTVRDLTLGWVANHGIQIQGEQNADRPTVYNIRFVDTYEQMLKISAGGSEFSDNGLVENCLFEYSAGIGPQWYIGGIDCHRSRDWIVRCNVFRDIQSPGNSTAEHAIHFWNYSENTLVECNWIINCDRGIGFGLGSSQHTGGIIRNNMIYHDTTGVFSDVGIGLETAPDAQVYNNTIYHEHAYMNAIEYRFAATTNVFIANNLTNKEIQARDGATGIDTSNVINAQPSWFISILTGDLHLSYSVPSVVDQGIPVTGLTSDFDGDLRPQGTGFDIGADEYTGTGIEEPIDLRPETRGMRLTASPNPFAELTEIRYQLSEVSPVQLTVFDISGHKVRELHNGQQSAGYHSSIWNGADEHGRAVPTGIYFCILAAGEYSESRNIVLIR